MRVDELGNWNHGRFIDGKVVNVDHFGLMYSTGYDLFRRRRCWHAING